MIKRIYIFIILGTLIENCYLLFQYFGVNQNTVYYTVFPTCQRVEIMLLPLWWIWQRLSPVTIIQEKATWVYLIAATYFIFQLIDVIDMAANENLRSAKIDFILFISLNISYWFIFRKTKLITK